MVYVMCFTDSTQESHYELSTMTPEEWEKANPALHLVYAFRKSDEVIYNSKCEREDFESLCGRYGFEPNEYQKTFKGMNGNELMLIGFIPRNRHYTCKLISTENGKFVKASPAYVRRYMDMSTTP